MKKCRFCAENIQDVASVCKHCGRSLRPRVSAVIVGVLLAFTVLLIIIAVSGSPSNNASDATPHVVEPKAPIMALSIAPDGLTIENLTDSPFDKCLIEILGGFLGEVPVLPAHASVSRNFLVLFDSEDHEAEAHLAGKTFNEFVLKNATVKTSVSCSDISGRRVGMTFR